MDDFGRWLAQYHILHGAGGIHRIDICQNCEEKVSVRMMLGKLEYWIELD